MVALVATLNDHEPLVREEWSSVLKQLGTAKARRALDAHSSSIL